MPKSRIVRKCYNMLLLYDNNGKKNWVSKVKHLLTVYGFGFVWLEQCVRNTDMFMKEFVNRLKVCYEQDWHFSLINGSKTFGYLLYKTVYSVETRLKS